MVWPSFLVGAPEVIEKRVVERGPRQFPIG